MYLAWHQNQRLEWAFRITWHLLNVTFLHFNPFSSKSFGNIPLPKLCRMTLPVFQDNNHDFWLIEKKKFLKVFFFRTTGWNEIKVGSNSSWVITFHICQHAVVSIYLYCDTTLMIHSKLCMLILPFIQDGQQGLWLVENWKSLTIVWFRTTGWNETKS